MYSSSSQAFFRGDGPSLAGDDSDWPGGKQAAGYSFTPNSCHTTEELRQQTEKWAGMWPLICSNRYMPQARLQAAMEIEEHIREELGQQHVYMVSWDPTEPAAVVRPMRCSRLMKIHQLPIMPEFNSREFLTKLEQIKTEVDGTVIDEDAMLNEMVGFGVAWVF